MTTTGWAKLCLKVGEQDFTNLQNVFNVAESLGGKKQGSDSSEGAEESSAGGFVNRKGLTDTCKKIFGNLDDLMPLKTIDEEEHEV
eukprot:7892267-Lingulodinium_polyedra.AAC.1